MKAFLSLATLAALAASSHAIVTSTFDTNDEGWIVVNYPDNAGNGDYDYTLPADNPSAVTYNPTGGNPGGYVSTNDPNGEDFYFQAPGKFLGNDAAAYGTNLTYDLANTGGGYNTAATVVLKGGGLTAVYDSATVPGTAFTPFSIPLTETGWHSNSYAGAAISQASFKTILASLTSLEVRGEYVVGGETASLDNVKLQASPVPEPTTIAALGLGLVALVRRRR